MNWKQRIVVWIGLVPIVAMGLYPPWVQEFRYSGFPFRHQTYSWIWRPPGAPGIHAPVVPHTADYDDAESIRGRRLGAFESALKSPLYWETEISISRLAVQWAVALFFVLGLAWSLSDRKAARSRDEEATV